MNPLFLAINPGVLALSIPIVSVICFTVLAVILRSYIHRERLAMLENGMNPKDLKTDWRSNKDDLHSSIRVACTAVGIGLGLFLGNLMRLVEVFDKGGIVAGMICMCGGLGLLVGYFLQMRVAKSNPSRTNDEAI